MLSSKALRFILSAGVDEADYRRVSHEIVASNRRSTIIFSTTASIFLAIMVVLSFTQESLAVSRWLYCTCCLVCIAILCLSRSLAKKSKALTLVLVYAFVGMLMVFGIFLGAVTVTNEITATYIALLLTAPQMFTDRPWRMYLLILCSDLIFIPMVLINKDPVTWSSDIVNALIFGGLSMVLCTYMSNIKVERFVLDATVRFMAENDQLTGLKNRNSFEQRLSSTDMLHGSSIFCVYVDVNGLHELNNTQGHAAGDRMLQYIAQVMQNSFGADNTYRVGGDEYIALGTDLSQEDAEAKVQAMRQAIETAGYHAAIGLSHQTKTSVELNHIVKDAETCMYADKEDYYTRNHIRHVRS